MPVISKLSLKPPDPPGTPLNVFNFKYKNNCFCCYGRGGLRPAGNYTCGVISSSILYQT